MNLDFDELTPIKGDASFRKFYRNKKHKKSSIIVFSRKENFKNLVVYELINRVLIKNRINAPKLISENIKKNYIEIEDLGNHTIYDLFKNKTLNKQHAYKKIIELLIKIQKIKITKIKDINKKKYIIPKYSNKTLYKESELFLKWYVPNLFKGKKKKKINSLLKKNINYLIKKIKLPNNTFVHRDFHVSNLILNKKKIAVIDSQDAVYGNPTYDLASLIDDVRFETNKKTKGFIYNYYNKKEKKKYNREQFKNDFDILSVLRNLKIIGIFSRLSYRDNKKKYLKLIPHAWKLIKYRIENNEELGELNKIIRTYFQNEIK